LTRCRRIWRRHAGSCRDGWFSAFGSFSQKTAGNSQRALRLLNIDGLGQDQVRANPECIRDAGLSFDYRHGQRTLVRIRITRTLEQKRGVLLVLAVHHDGVEMLSHEFLDGSEGFAASLDAEFQLGQNLCRDTSGFLIRTEEKRLKSHNKVIVGTLR
jgi:hypothetical protein